MHIHDYIYDIKCLFDYLCQVKNAHLLMYLTGNLNTLKTQGHLVWFLDSGYPCMH